VKSWLRLSFFCGAQCQAEGELHRVKVCLQGDKTGQSSPFEVRFLRETDLGATDIRCFVCLEVHELSHSVGFKLPTSSKNAQISHALSAQVVDYLLFIWIFVRCSCARIRDMEYKLWWVDEVAGVDTHTTAGQETGAAQ